MKKVVIGTAGHIDHGKTALVRELTGIDCDRLPQEQERGITIELGFAGLVLGDLQISLIDVPGHERFVRNMLAGAGGIDGVVLVVAADESVMPQTEEHLDICRLLGIEHCLVALTKIDLVDEEIIGLAELEISERVAGIFARDPAVVPLSVRTGEGVETFRAELGAMASRASLRRARRAEELIFRLPVDRVFAMRGFGTVVTGTVTGGRLSGESLVEILPTGARSRVRGLQVHHEERRWIEDGERASMNLPDLDRTELERGAVVTLPDQLLPTTRLTCRIEVVGEEREIVDDQRFHVHHLASEVTGRLRIVGSERKRLASGEWGWAQLHLDAPVVAVAGDRLVLRTWSPMQTVAGGVVIEPHARAMKKRTRESLLERIASSDLDDRLSWMAREAGLAGVSAEEISVRTGIRREIVGERLTRARDEELVMLGERWLHRGAIRDLREAAMKLLESWFHENPVSTGMPKGEFLQKLIPAPAPDAIRSALLEDLEAEGIAVLERSVVNVPGRDSRPGGRMGDLAGRIETIFEQRGLDPPSLREIADETTQKNEVVQGLTRYLVETGQLRRLADGLYVHRKTIDEVRQDLAREAGSTIDVKWVKDRFGLTRKVAIPLLEYLDESGVTVRVGDRRKIL